ncbi:hypothetical protein EPUS_05722 [Endocarpon pusillum Z07020]|uniref:Uncharacterized protein n=1 Tax=Endocarpon pusillum (strain Z07020 / HMAS-L-300199) TaxID=1263415 RepID=U1GAH1_ENDPU|nr:uncharacterized protein EPUS_05722 [Endocarpon pusillum Z07020]ERF68661.1 hypothetical protein EPUS_05722 [Endocarpon pusillum Z07020]
MVLDIKQNGGTDLPLASVRDANFLGQLLQRLGAGFQFPTNAIHLFSKLAEIYRRESESAPIWFIFMIRIAMAKLRQAMYEPFTWTDYLSAPPDPSNKSDHKRYHLWSILSMFHPLEVKMNARGELDPIAPTTTMTLVSNLWRDDGMQLAFLSYHERQISEHCTLIPWKSCAHLERTYLAKDSQLKEFDEIYFPGDRSNARIEEAFFSLGQENQAPLMTPHFQQAGVVVPDSNQPQPKRKPEEDGAGKEKFKSQRLASPFCEENDDDAVSGLFGNVDIGYDELVPFEIYVDSRIATSQFTPHESYVKEPENVLASPAGRAKSL